MVVRDDVAVGTYDDAGAERLLPKLALRLLLQLRRAAPEEVPRLHCNEDRKEHVERPDGYRDLRRAE